MILTVVSYERKHYFLRKNLKLTQDNIGMFPYYRFFKFSIND